MGICTKTAHPGPAWWFLCQLCTKLRVLLYGNVVSSIYSNLVCVTRSPGRLVFALEIGGKGFLTRLCRRRHCWSAASRKAARGEPRGGFKVAYLGASKFPKQDCEGLVGALKPGLLSQLPRGPAVLMWLASGARRGGLRGPASLIEVRWMVTVPRAGFLSSSRTQHS